jgi:hypothetical protein
MANHSGGRRVCIERLWGSTDVVIGLLETHGRRETARQAEGLKPVPCIRLRHRGIELQELDVASTLERRPQLRGLGLGPHLEAGQEPGGAASW